MSRIREIRGLLVKRWNCLGTNIRLLILLILILLPIIYSLIFIKLYAVNVSSYDDVTFVPLFEKLYTGHLSFSDLSIPHNEHRILFPKVVMLVLGHFTHHNTVISCFCSWILLCCLCITLFIVHKHIIRNLENALMTFVPVSWLLFSPGQAGNLLRGFQLQVFMIIFFFVLSMYFLVTTKRNYYRLFLSIIFGIISTFSMNNGILVWLIGLVILILSHKTEQKEDRLFSFLKISLWSFASILVLFLYYYDYSLWNGDIKIEYVTQHLDMSVIWFFTSLGSLGRFQEPIIASIVGLLILIGFIYTTIMIFWRAKPQMSTIIYLSVIVFVLLTFIGWTYNRAYLGIEESLADRSVTIGVLGVAVLYLAIITNITKYIGIKTIVLNLLVLVILFCGISSYYEGIVIAGPRLKSFSTWQSYLLSTYSIQSETNLQSIYSFGTPIVREAGKILQKYKLNIFSKPSIDLERLDIISANTKSSIDCVNDITNIEHDEIPVWISKQDSTISISGWAIDLSANDIAGGVFINIDGEKNIPTLYGIERPDLSSVFGGNKFRYSGFQSSFSISVIGEGEHIMSLLIITADKKCYYIGSQHILLDIE
jgi:hypothetical protein